MLVFQTIKYKHYFALFDQLVLATFTCELILKWYYGFWIYWKVGWNVLDFLIIAMLLIGPALPFLSKSHVLRILRVLRAFRSVRNVSALAGLSMVVQTILQSIPDMANIVLLLLIIMIVLAVAGVTLFGQYVPLYFGGLGQALYSLFICMTQDGWLDLYAEFKDTSGSPAKKQNADMLYAFGTAYFLLVITLLAFTFANLVVAIVVTNLEIAMNDLKEEKQKQVDTLAPVVEVKDDDDLLPKEAVEKAPTVAFDELKEHVDFFIQTPLEKTDLSGITVEKLEEYFLLLVALEDNLSEYQDIRHDLDDMFNVVRGLNEFDGDSDDEIAVQHPAMALNIQNLKKGDILSNLIKLEEQSVLRSDEANTMDDVIKRTIRPNIIPKRSGVNMEKKKSKDKNK